MEEEEAAGGTDGRGAGLEEEEVAAGSFGSAKEAAVEEASGTLLSFPFPSNCKI